MSIDAGLDAGRVDIHRLAAAARSILACADEVGLVVDGVDDLTAGLDEGLIEMQDHHGRPVFSCAPDSPLAQAAGQHRGAVLTVRSGLGQPGSPDRDATLTLSGRLEATGLDDCPCCTEARLRVTLHLDFAVLARENTPEPAAALAELSRVRVPLAAFTSSEHDLNRGFLQRSAEHANLCHQDELRRAIATRTSTRLGDLLGVHLSDLHAEGLALQWIDTSGAHEAELRFPRPATSAADLGDLLRDQLHAGLC